MSEALPYDPLTDDRYSLTAYTESLLDSFGVNPECWDLKGFAWWASNIEKEQRELGIILTRKNFWARTFNTLSVFENRRLDYDDATIVDLPVGAPFPPRRQPDDPKLHAAVLDRTLRELWPAYGCYFLEDFIAFSQPRSYQPAPGKFETCDPRLSSLTKLLSKIGSYGNRCRLFSFSGADYIKFARNLYKELAAEFNHQTLRDFSQQLLTMARSKPVEWAYPSLLLAFALGQSDPALKKEIQETLIKKAAQLYGNLPPHCIGQATEAHIVHDNMLSVIGAVIDKDQYSRLAAAIDHLSELEKSDSVKQIYQKHADSLRKPAGVLSWWQRTRHR